MKDCRQNYNTNFSFIHGGSTVCFADSDPRPTIKSNFLRSNKNLPPAALRKEKTSLPRISAERDVFISEREFDVAVGYKKPARCAGF